MFIAVAPLLYMTSTALGGVAYVQTYPPRLIPETVSFENFEQAFASRNFLRAFFNSAGVSIATSFLVTALASTMAYSFARFEFRFKNVIFGVLLVMIMIPRRGAAHPAVHTGEELRPAQQPAGDRAGLTARGRSPSTPSCCAASSRTSRANWKNRHHRRRESVHRVLARDAAAGRACHQHRCRVQLLGAWDEYLPRSTFS
ncbi:hypothetical protein [Candidatus Flexifilum breve]|uniref:hypothetical protein n=1 Tax=Candidatus Flexifilum breve TaxID=3140694 RepID=UPI0031CC7BAE